MKYLKYLDNLGKAENTLKSYCYHLMLYFKFLNEERKVYEDVSLDLLSDFIGWLRHVQEDLAPCEGGFICSSN
ncbi:site-specific integrase [Brevibacillus laterosporus]|uniref:site-specific integrase n=1 Tax=Brevibacillus laterosporus TaxID=1465 RepID=UPI003D23E763